MPFNYARMATLAAQQIRNFGTSVTINRYAPTADDLTGRATKGTPSRTATPNAVGLGVKYRREPGTLTRVKTQAFLMAAGAALPFVPVADDELVDSTGARWVVQDCNVVVPATTPIIYQVNTEAA